jgi:excisionase family DNA binding protein
MPIQWITSKEAARQLRISHRSVMRWAACGRIPAHPLTLAGSKHQIFRFDPDELDAFLAQRGTVIPPSVSRGNEK